MSRNDNEIIENIIDEIENAVIAVVNKGKAGSIKTKIMEIIDKEIKKNEIS